MFLVLSAFTSRPISFLATTTAFLYSMNAFAEYNNIISYSEVTRTRFKISVGERGFVSRAIQCLQDGWVKNFVKTKERTVRIQLRLTHVRKST